MKDSNSGHHPHPNGLYERTYYIRWKEPTWSGDLHYNNANYTVDENGVDIPTQFSWPWAPYFQWTDQVTAEPNCPVESRQLSSQAVMTSSATLSVPLPGVFPVVPLTNNMDTAPYQYVATNEWRAAVSLPYMYDRNSVDMGGYTFHLHACTRGPTLGDTPAGGDCLTDLASRLGNTDGSGYGIVPQMTLFVECDDRSTYIIDGLTGSTNATQEQEVGGQHGFYVYEFLSAFGNSCPVIGYQIVTKASTWRTSGSVTATGQQADSGTSVSGLPPAGELSLPTWHSGSKAGTYNTGESSPGTNSKSPSICLISL